MVAQGAGGAAAPPQQIQQRRDQRGDTAAVAGGHRELGPAHLTALHRPQHQVAQRLAHGLLLLQGQSEDQRHPQPVGHEAVAEPGQAGQPQQRTHPQQGLPLCRGERLAQVGGEGPVQFGEHGAGGQPGAALRSEVGAQLRQQPRDQLLVRRGAVDPPLGALSQQARFWGVAGRGNLLGVEPPGSHGLRIQLLAQADQFLAAGRQQADVAAQLPLGGTPVGQRPGRENRSPVPERHALQPGHQGAIHRAEEPLRLRHHHRHRIRVLGRQLLQRLHRSAAFRAVAKGGIPLEGHPPGQDPLLAQLLQPGPQVPVLLVRQALLLQQE